MLRHLEVAQPFRKRNPEALLWTVQNEVRNHALKRTLEQVLALARAKLEVTGKPAREVHEIVVEKHGAGLERAHHGDSIRLRQYVVLKVEPREELQRTVGERQMRGIAPGLEHLRVEVLLRER